MPRARVLKSIDPKLIKVDRAQRQRQMNLDISDLIPSIRARGVLQPILCRQCEDGVWLVAGERRLLTTLHLEKDSIEYLEVPFGVTELEIQIIEQEENLRRKDLTWQDKARSFLRIHRLLVANARAEDEWDTDKTAAYLGYNEEHIYRMVGLAEAMEGGDTAIIEAQTMANAVTILTRRRQRATGDALNRILEIEDDGETDTEGAADLIGGLEEPVLFNGQVAGGTLSQGAASTGRTPGGTDRGVLPQRAVAPPYAIIHGDAHQFLASYSGPKFNFLHCDLPYGVALNAQAGQAGFEGGGYESSPDIYWQLCKSLVENWDKFMYPAAHVMFWISMKFYTETVEFFEEHVPGIKINPVPMTWLKSDNKGIIPDALRGPRQITEVCLLMSTGDRHIVKPVSNGYVCPTSKSTSIHTNEKPEPMLKHFFSMLVDSRVRMLDPTCGSGSSIRAAEALGAEAALGLEFNPEFAERAQQQLITARGLRSLSDIVAEAETEELDSAEEA